MSMLDGPATLNLTHSLTDQLEKCRSPDGCAPASCCVGGMVYITMSDEVVDGVMHRRGSIGLGWLEQPLTGGRAM